MKNLLLLLCLLVCLSSYSQERDINERYLPKKELKYSQKNVLSKPHISKKMLRGGGGDGGITSTDCYSFVPIPENAIELDENSPDSGNSLDGAWGPFDLDFEFCHFGINYDQFYINMKGNITFDNFNTTFVPAGFPSDDFAMIAGFWADIDLQCAGCGTVYYWTTPTAAYITFLDVGYYNQHGDLDNTFQIVITDQSDEVVGLGNNVGLFYQDMQWAAGDWNGGTDGFGGTAAGTVGANRNDGVNFIQFGRFLDDSNDYDGPFGAVDGIDWLDDKAFVFNLCSSEDNLPPISGNSDACDTLYICQNDTYEFDLSFIGPEPGQTVTVTIDDSGADGWVMTSNGDGFMTGFFAGGPGNIGEHTLVFTATDSGSPSAQSVVIYNIVIQDITLPTLSVTGPGFVDDIIPYCGGQPGAELTASDGFDDYVWSNNTNGQTNTLNGGTYSLVGLLEGCQMEYGPFSVYQIPSFNPLVLASDYFICEGEETQLVLQEEDTYLDYAWEVFNANGEILSDDLTNDSITVTPGTYQVTAINPDGCEGSVVIPIVEQVVSIPNNNFDILCDQNSINWSGGWTNPENCAHFIYLYDNESDTWEGANVEVYIDGTGPLNYNISNSAGFSPYGFPAYNGQLIEYVFVPGLDDDDVNVAIYECGNDTPVFDSNLPGDDLVPGVFFTQIANTTVNELEGQWTSSCPEGTFSNPTVFNPINGIQTYTVPEGFYGTCELSFEAGDICDLSVSFEATFSTDAEVNIIETSLNGCSEGVLIQPEYGPAALVDQLTYDWTPNLDCDGNPDCMATSSSTYIVTVSGTGCDNASDQVVIGITSEPNPTLFNDILCGDETQVLNPGGTSDSEFSWTGPGVVNETGSTLEVSQEGDYTVTVTNDCGTNTATAVIITGDVPSVSYDSSELLFCAGDVNTISPVWSEGSEPLISPISWTISYFDSQNISQTEFLGSTEQSLIIGSEQFPEDLVDNSLIISFSTTTACGNTSGSIPMQLIPCFIQAPNVITPNSDSGTSLYADPNNPGLEYNQGLNEAWYLSGIENLEGIAVRIYDRWGGLVYSNDNYKNNDPWFGNHDNGSELENGTYFYTIVASNNIEPIEGTVSVFR